MRVLIVGASGYNGNLVAQRLRDEGHWVRGLVRDARRAPVRLDDVVVGDVTTGTGLRTALQDVDVAYYFVHSLDAVDQDERDLVAARQFVAAAKQTGLARGVFFTTLTVPDGVRPPAYQRNRLNVEQELLEGVSGMSAVRAGMVLGAQSRGLRPYLQLLTRAPVIPMGPWRKRRMAVVDTNTTTECLVRAGTAKHSVGRTADVPATAEPTHEELVRAILGALGIEKPIIRLPWSSATLDAFLTSRFTDDSFHFSRHLASINRYDYTVDPKRAKPFADMTPLGLAAALRLAVAPLEDFDRRRR